MTDEQLDTYLKQDFSETNSFKKQYENDITSNIY